MFRKTGAGLAVTLFAFAPPAMAQAAHQDWQAIDAMTQMVAQAMGRTAAPIDRRIKLARCPEQAAIVAIDARTLAVRCPSLGWRLRVPMTGPAGAATPAGFSRPAAPVIRRGDNVHVTIDTANFSVSYSAIAAEDGRVGETITLRDDDRRTRLSAIVTGPGAARLND